MPRRREDLALSREVSNTSAGRRSCKAGYWGLEGIEELAAQHVSETG